MPSALQCRRQNFELCELVKIDLVLQGKKLIDRLSDNKEVLIDISKFQKGTYLLKINAMTDKKTVTKKIIKQ